MSRTVAESQSVRRVVGALDMGEDLLRGLLSVCKDHSVRCGLIRATGVLKSLSVQHHEMARKGPGLTLALDGPLNLLSAAGALSELGGKLELSLQVVASRQGDNGVEVVGGACESASVLACDFVIEVLDDLLLRRGIDRRTGLYVWTDAISLGGAPAPAPVAEPAENPGRPALESLQLMDPPAPELTASDQQVTTPAPMPEPPPPEEPEEDDEDDEPYRPVRIGDVIMHQQFGECLVQRVSVDQEYATVRRTANKRLVRLSLEVLDLLFKEETDDHQVFEARPARR